MTEVSYYTIRIQHKLLNLSGWRRFLKSLKTSMMSLILCDTIATSGATAGTITG